MGGSQKISRRNFVKLAAGSTAALGFPTIVPASALGRAGRPAPSNRIVMGSIGTGHMGTNNLRDFLQKDEVQYVAVCDVDRERRLQAKAIVEDYYAGRLTSSSWRGCADYNDFRDLLARDDIDAVSIATPDHWHAIPSIQAAHAGKDIYCEKPLGLTVEQGRAMSDAVRRNGRVFQTGSQLRSRAHVARGIELVRNGRIGRIREVTATCGPGWALPLEPEMPVPDGFDYDMWLGPAPWAPYTEMRCHSHFRWNLDYSGGQLTDHGAHYCDLAQWGLDREHSGPVEFEGTGVFPEDGLYNTATAFRVECRYSDGVKLIVANEGRRATTFIGEDGWINTSDGSMESDPPHIGRAVDGANEIRLYRGKDHQQDFLDCVKSRLDPIAPVEVAHRSVTIGHIGNMALKLGRKLRWNPEAERFVDDPEADRMLSRPMRAPWRL